MGKLLTVKEALEIAKVSRYTLYKDIKSGKIKSINFGRNVRFREEDVLAYAKLERKTQGAGAEK